MLFTSSWACRLFPVPWWGHHLGQHDGAWWLRTLQPAVLHSMPSRQRLGVLNAAHDLVKHLGHKLKPFLPEVCALVLVLLQGSSLSSDQVKPAFVHVLQIPAVLWVMSILGLHQHSSSQHLYLAKAFVQYQLQCDLVQWYLIWSPTATAVVT